jgi:hypothetical protein
MQSGDAPASGGPNGSRGFGNREHLHLAQGLGNQVRTVVEIDLPPAWFFTGGAHFGGWVGWTMDGEESIRADWNAPSSSGLRQTLYVGQEGASGAWTKRAGLRAGVQVFWPGTFTKCTYTAVYDPVAGTFDSSMLYEHPQIAGGKVSAVSHIEGVPRVGALLGQFAKWGRMHPSTAAGRTATAWIRNDTYSGF